MTYSLTKELCFLFSDREKRKSKINAGTKRNEPMILKLKLKKLTMVFGSPNFLTATQGQLILHTTAEHYSAQFPRIAQKTICSFTPSANA